MKGGEAVLIAKSTAEQRLLSRSKQGHFMMRILVPRRGPDNRVSTG